MIPREKFLLGPGSGDFWAYMVLGKLPLAVVASIWLAVMGGLWLCAAQGDPGCKTFLRRYALFPVAHGLVIVSELAGRYTLPGVAATVGAFLVAAFIFLEALRTIRCYLRAQPSR